MRISRKKFLQMASSGMLLPLRWRLPRAFAQIPGGTLDPTDIPKYVTPLVKPPAMPKTSRQGIPSNIDYYEIAVRQFRQQILPAGLPTTTVWGYGSVNHPDTFNYPAFTIEPSQRPGAGQVDQRPDGSNGGFLPHLLPVDPTLHWANPPGGTAGRDMRPDLREHARSLHGPRPDRDPPPRGHTPQESDGYPEAWYLPAANNIPAGFATEGTWYDPFKAEFQTEVGRALGPRHGDFQYDNDQRAATLWYHDHTLGMTRLNVYAGPAGFYLLRGGPGDLSGPRTSGSGAGRRRRSVGTYYEIPIAIQDRSFNADGSLFYPDSRSSSTASPGRSFPTPTSRPSGTRSSSATRWWSTAGPGPTWRSSRAATASASSTAATPAS